MGQIRAPLHPIDRTGEQKRIGTWVREMMGRTGFSGRTRFRVIAFSLFNRQRRFILVQVISYPQREEIFCFF